MFFSRLTNAERDKTLLPAFLHAGIDYLCNADFRKLDDGKHEINDQCYVSIASYVTEPAENRKPESHKQYIDIQYIVEGEEAIGCADMTFAGKLREEIPENDLLFYETVNKETYLSMVPGSFAVFYPWDVHRPNCSLGDAGSSVRKAIVKVKCPPEWGKTE
jgi:YhcH/YjgK/YiaL family protein